MKAKARFYAKGQSDAMRGRCAKLAHLPRWAADAYRAGHREGLRNWVRTTVLQLGHSYARPGGMVSGRA